MQHELALTACKAEVIDGRGVLVKEWACTIFSYRYVVKRFLFKNLLSIIEEGHFKLYHLRETNSSTRVLYYQCIKVF